jgi:hypothetical protein
MKAAGFFMILFYAFYIKPSYLQAQGGAGKLIEELAEDLASDFRKKVNKADLPLGCKIYVLPFRTGKEFDTIRTKLGLKIATQFSLRLRRMASNGEFDCKPEILSSGEEATILNEIQLKHLQPPSSLAEESAFYKQLSLSRKPDFYFTGSYEPGEQYEYIRLKGTVLVKDKLNRDLSKFSDIFFEEQQTDIKPSCRNELSKWDIPLTPPADAFLKLIQFQKDANPAFATMALIDGKSNSAINKGGKIKLGVQYQLKAELASDAYLYAFYYESEDPLHKMYMIGPLDEKSNRLCKAGTVLLPDDKNTIEPSPPSSRQALVKLIASRQKLPLAVTTTPEGYICLGAEEALRFVSILEKMKKEDISTTKLLYEIE